MSLAEPKKINPRLRLRNLPVVTEMNVAALASARSQTAAPKSTRRPKDDNEFSKDGVAPKTTKTQTKKK